MFNQATVFTRPTPARQDAPFHRQGRSERRGESYSLPYAEPLSDARTQLEDFFSILLDRDGSRGDGHVLFQAAIGRRR